MMWLFSLLLLLLLRADGEERDEEEIFVKAKMIISIWEFNAFVIHSKKKYREAKERKKERGENWTVYMNGL